MHFEKKNVSLKKCSFNKIIVLNIFQSKNIFHIIYYIYKRVFGTRVLRNHWTDFNNRCCVGFVHSWAVYITMWHPNLTHNPSTRDQNDLQAVRWKPAVSLHFDRICLQSEKYFLQALYFCFIQNLHGSNGQRSVGCSIDSKQNVVQHFDRILRFD